MSPADIVVLRSTLELNPLQLAERLGVPVRLVLQWESGDRFPTKRHCQLMSQWVKNHPVAPQTAAEGTPSPPPLGARPTSTDSESLADVVVRQLLSNPDFERRLRALVTDYLDSSSEKSESGASPQSSSDASSDAPKSGSSS